MAECSIKRKTEKDTGFENAGFQFPLSFLLTPKSIQSCLSIRLRENDIILSSYPKCDSNLVDLIVWKLLFPQQKVPEVNSATNRHIPCIEMTIAEDYTKLMHKLSFKFNCPRLFKTYLPFKLIPLYKRAKYIYVTRTPWKACSSYYRMLYLTGSTDSSFDNFYRDFLSGNVGYESIFEHVEPWINLHACNNILIVSHEHIHNNPRSAMFTIAAFLGERYLNQLINYPEYEKSILKSMKWDEPKIKKIVDADPPLVKEIAYAFFPKGEAQNIEKPLCSADQVKELAKRMSEKLKGTSLEQLWQNLLKQHLVAISAE